MAGPVISAFNDALARISAIDKEIAKHDAAKLDLQMERAALVQDLQHARDVLVHLTPTAEPMENVEIIATLTIPSRKRPIRQSSSVGFAREVLSIAKHDMHIDEIIEMIWKMHGKRVSKATLVSNLSRYVKAKDTFVRSAPNVYGLMQAAADGGVQEERLM